MNKTVHTEIVLGDQIGSYCRDEDEITSMLKKKTKKKTSKKQHKNKNISSPSEKNTDFTVCL